MLVERKVRVVRRNHFEPAALVCSVFAEIHRNKDQRSEPFQPADFLKDLDTPPADAMSEGEIMLRKLQGLNLFWGGKNNLPERIQFLDKG